MGCFDLFCPLCGNSYHSISTDLIENFREIHQHVKSNKKTASHLKTFYKKVYNILEKDSKFLDKIKTYSKKTRWLNDCTFLTVLDEVIHHCKEVYCNNTFRDKKGNHYIQDLLYNDEFTPKSKRGIFVHTDCWKYVKQKYDITLTFSNIPVIPEPKEYNKINTSIHYGKIENYWSQIFKFEELFIDDNDYMCISPLVSKENASRINKIISQYKFNSDKSRKGPSVSATFYPENAIKYGNNGMLWIKKGGKWVEIKDCERMILKIDETKQHKVIKNIECMGQFTKKPIMVKKMDNKQIEFIGTIGEIRKVQKILL